MFSEELAKLLDRMRGRILARFDCMLNIESDEKVMGRNSFNRINKSRRRPLLRRKRYQHKEMNVIKALVIDLLSMHPMFGIVAALIEGQERPKSCQQIEVVESAPPHTVAVEPARV